MTAPRNILVVGATGKQGRAIIDALSQLPPTPDGFRIVALTRSIQTASAQGLLSKATPTLPISLAEGDLDNPSSIRVVFENAKPAGGIWGVFAVLAYPGLGKNADGEEAQGKLLADMSLEFEVHAFVYSSTIYPGPREEDCVDLSHKAKRRIEEHCRDLGKKGLRWSIIRPGFFMENLDGFLGSVATTILQQGLAVETTLLLTASEDIGKVAAGVFQNHDSFVYQSLAVTSGPVTIAEIADSYLRATKRPMPTIPAVAAKALLRINEASQNLIKQMERNHEARTTGEDAAFAAEWTLAQSVCGMQSYYEWKVKSKSEESYARGWNQLSIGALLTGRS